MVKQFFTEQGNQIHVHDINDILTLAKDLKIFPPGRPNVSGIVTLTENISSFIDSNLQRLILLIPSYIKDTAEFINKPASIMTISSDVLLVTMDVTSLYTNIPHVDGVDACSQFLNDHCVTDIATDVLCSLISFILTHNNFVFDDHDYLETSGTAMGTKMAPWFANIFMASTEQTFINSSPLTPLFFVRFIDDIFMIWTHGSEELEQFTTRANSTLPSIKFTTEISSTSFPFQDVLVCVTETSIKTSLCRKPTDRPTYLMYHSLHPHHIKSSTVFSQNLGLKRICSDISDYEHEVKILTQSLLYRGYPYKLFSKQINHASHIVRTKSLKRNSNKNTNEKRITFITQFHQSISTFLKNVNKDWQNIRTHNRFNNKLSNPIILANKQPRNLQPVLTTHSCNVINHVTNHDVMFVHILISDAVSNLTMMSHSLLPKLTVTHRTWSTSYFVLSARTLFMLVKHPTVLDFDLTITNTAINIIFMAIPYLCTSMSNHTQ